MANVNNSDATNNNSEAARNFIEAVIEVASKPDEGFTGFHPIEVASETEMVWERYQDGVPTGETVIAPDDEEPTSSSNVQR
jgi:predicted Rdx family selenoprotein